MKSIRYILLIITAIITGFFIWIYLQRAALDYNSEGRFFSAEEGIVYQEQSKDVYGFFALLGLILTGILFIQLRKKKRR